MTRQTVRNAYSDVRPTQEQKDKMWKAIMEQKENRPMETHREKPFGVFRASTLAASLALVAMLTVVVWFGGGRLLSAKEASPQMNAMGAETYAAPAEQVLKDESTASVSRIEESDMGSGADALYRPILEKYVTAIRNHSDPGQCSAADISMLTGYVESLDALGWYCTDLDGNGAAELLVSDGNVIYDLYTLEKGEVVHLASGYERISYQLCENGTIKNYGASSAAESSYTMYRLVGSSLVEEQVVTFDAAQDQENPWFIGFDRTPASEAEAQAVIDSYKEIEIPITLFSQSDW